NKIVVLLGVDSETIYLVDIAGYDISALACGSNGDIEHRVHNYSFLGLLEKVLVLSVLAGCREYQRNAWLALFLHL
ncbi:MAG: hypothetical protein KAR30_01845, partial [Gammaproteobacteria bacterium]|nr:hypothetical protein [Gammaproteobacteria bacterium]